MGRPPWKERTPGEKPQTGVDTGVGKGDAWPHCPNCGTALDFAGRCSGCDYRARDEGAAEPEVLPK